jgi:hypothetical protein
LDVRDGYVAGDGDAGQHKTARVFDIQAVRGDMKFAMIVRLIIVERVGDIGTIKAVQSDFQIANVV